MDLPKAFDNINHDLLIAKLHVYEFFKEKVFKINKKLISNHWLRIKVNLSFSSSPELTLGVPQWTVLWPPLFSINTHDLNYLTGLTDVCYYADDTNFNACNSNLEDPIRRLGHDAILGIEWFESNYMRLN